tara:strand:+ start:133 stop:852 length:720 start_codon:yes stop_codon:yes gene_type:complete
MNEALIKNFWSDIDERLDFLQTNGYVKLPSLSFLELEKFADNIYEEIGDATFQELGQAHKEFIDLLQINEYLVPKLHLLAKNKFNFTGSQEDQYHIARKVEPGNSKEMFRGHFDSHLFTIVFPISIPKKEDEDCNNGQLAFFPNLREHPSNEISNILSKIYYKKFASKNGLKQLSKKAKMKIENFEKLEPLLFLGNTFLHTNYPVDFKCKKYRLTLLAHFFDPSPKYGIGSFLRMIRNR